MKVIVLIAHNLRSAHNVGSILRTAEGLGVHKVILSGYSPYPLLKDDPRLPHEARKTSNQIAKTALGAEHAVPWDHQDDIFQLIADLKQQGYTVAALEQAPEARALPAFTPPDALALIVGREVEGVEPEVLAACDFALEIPMSGQKESFNVSAAAAMALYHVRFTGTKL